MNNRQNNGPTKKVASKLVIFLIGATAGALLSLNSGLWLGIPILIVIGIWLYLWRRGATARIDRVATAFQLISTFLGTFGSVLLASSVNGTLGDDGVEHFTPGRIILMLFCGVMVAVVYRLEVWAQEIAD